MLQSFFSEGRRYCHANVLVFNYIKERPVRSVRLYALCFRVCLYASIFMLVCPCVCDTCSSVYVCVCVRDTCSSVCVCVCVCVFSIFHFCFLCVLYLCVCVYHCDCVCVCH